MRRVAITGLGVISPIGSSASEVMDSLLAARPGISRLEGESWNRLVSRIAAPVAFEGGQYFDAPKLRMLDRVSQFALVATRQALGQAQLDLTDIDPARVGVFLGTGMGGAQTTDECYHSLYAEQSDRLKPFSVIMAMNNAAAAWIGLEYGVTGPNLTYTTACSSSAVGIGEAAQRIRSGQCDIMIAGGAEAPLWLGPMKAWEALRTLATEDPVNPAASCKPFCKERTGMVLAEGAAVVILEEWDRAIRRNAPILAEFTGYGLVTDNAHLTRPSIDGQARAMQLALNSANLAAHFIDYINAHGTGTQANDPVETAAIKQVFGTHAYQVPVSSTKSLHGHLLGAAGALEFAISVLAMNAGVLPPTAHLSSPDPECDLDYVPNQARTHCTINTIMSNSFAFGGTNAVLIAQRPT